MIRDFQRVTNTAAGNEPDPRMLSSVIISTKTQHDNPSQGRDPHDCLLEYMYSAPIKAILEAAQIFSQREGLPVEEALRQIVVQFRNVDQLWSQVLLKEGLTRLSSQYH